MTVIWAYLHSSQKSHISNPWLEKSLFVLKRKHLVSKDYASNNFQDFVGTVQYEYPYRVSKTPMNHQIHWNWFASLNRSRFHNFLTPKIKHFCLSIKKPQLWVYFDSFPNLIPSWYNCTGGYTPWAVIAAVCRLLPVQCSKEGQFWISQWTSSGQSKVPVILDMHGTMLVW